MCYANRKRTGLECMQIVISSGKVRLAYFLELLTDVFNIWDALFQTWLNFLRILKGLKLELVE